MNFTAHNNLFNTIRTDNVIREDGFDVFSLSDLEGYKKLLRPFFNNFHNEIMSNYDFAVVNNIEKKYLKILRLKLQEWQGLKAYIERKVEYLREDHDVINDDNEEAIKQFLGVKFKYCEKVLSKIIHQTSLLEQTDLNETANSNISPANETVKPSQKGIHGFYWNKSIRARTFFFQELANNGIISEEVSIEAFNLAFSLDSKKLIHCNLGIKWLLKVDKSRLFHKGALTYLIKQLENHEIIKSESPRNRNRKIEYCFCKEDGTEIKDLKNAKSLKDGHNKELIDRIINLVLA